MLTVGGSAVEAECAVDVAFKDRLGVKGHRIGLIRFGWYALLLALPAGARSALSHRRLGDAAVGDDEIVRPSSVNRKCPPANIVKSKHWLARAAEIRAIAASMAEDGIRASMLRLAKDYDKLAARAIARSGAKDVGP